MSTEFDYKVLATRVVQTRSGGRVERCHGIPHQGSYNNAAHSWGVAMLLHAIWPEDFGRLALNCLSHDVAEAWVGDVPAPTMRYVPGLRQQLGALEGRLCEALGLPREDAMAPEDHAKLKACDRLEFWLWCREQRLMGNSFAAEAQEELERYLIETPLPARAQLLFIALRDRANSVLPTQQGVMKELCS